MCRYLIQGSYALIWWFGESRNDRQIKSSYLIYQAIYTASISFFLYNTQATNLNTANNYCFLSKLTAKYLTRQ